MEIIGVLMGLVVTAGRSVGFRRKIAAEGQKVSLQADPNTRKPRTVCSSLTAFSLLR
jgi:hypothetical protein